MSGEWDTQKKKNVIDRVMEACVDVPIDESEPNSTKKWTYPPDEDIANIFDMIEVPEGKATCTVYFINMLLGKRHSNERHSSFYFVILDNHRVPPDRHCNYTFTLY